MLTDQQKTFFEVFGFLVLPQAFSPKETESISRQFDEVLNDDRDGREFPGDKRQAVMGFVEQRAELTRLVEDDRIFCCVEELLGRKTGSGCTTERIRKETIRTIQLRESAYRAGCF